MFPDCFYEHHNSLHQKIHRHFDLAAGHFEVEAIHDLRVEIKRLRAFFDLIEFINPNFQARQNYKKIRKLFKAAGPVRDVHVQQQVVRAWSKKLALDPSEYYNFLKQKEMTVRSEFADAAVKFNFVVFEKNAALMRTYLQFLPMDFVESKTHAQLDLLLQRLFDLRKSEDGSPQNFHEIRIGLKAARYTLEVLQICFQKEDLSPLNNQLRLMHQALGKWHDEEVGLESLEAFLQDQNAAQFFSKESYQLYAQNLRDDKSRLLDDFESRWKEFT